MLQGEFNSKIFSTFFELKTQEKKYYFNRIEKNIK